MREALLYGIEQEIKRDRAVADRLAATHADVRSGRLSPFRAARDLLDAFRRH